MAPKKKSAPAPKRPNVETDVPPETDKTSTVIRRRKEGD
jgi:hypothetical protein